MSGSDEKEDMIPTERSRKVSSGAFQNKFLSLPSMDARQNPNDGSVPASGISIGRLNDHLKNQPMGFKRRRSLKKSGSTNQTLPEVSEDSDEQNEVVPTQDPDLTISQLPPNPTESQMPVESNIVHQQHQRAENKHLAELVDADCHEVKGWWHVQISTDKALGDDDDSSSFTSNDD